MKDSVNRMDTMTKLIEILNSYQTSGAERKKQQATRGERTIRLQPVPHGTEVANSVAKIQMTSIAEIMSARRTASTLIHQSAGFTASILESTRATSSYAHELHRHRVLACRRVLERALTHILCAAFPLYEQQGAVVVIPESGEQPEISDIVAARQNNLVSQEDATRLTGEQLGLAMAGSCAGGEAEKDEDGTKSEAESARSSSI